MSTLTAYSRGAGATQQTPLSTAQAAAVTATIAVRTAGSTGACANQAASGR
jgi:hypothetical protein